MDAPRRQRSAATTNRTASERADPLHWHLKRLGHRVVPSVRTAHSASAAYTRAAHLASSSARSLSRSCRQTWPPAPMTSARSPRILSALLRTQPFLAGESSSRLLHHPPPGGLAGCKPPDCDVAAIVRAAIRLDGPSTYGRCVVVSSSRSLVNSGLGECIDGFDGVFRFNDAPLVSEIDLGKKTTFRLATYSPWRVIAASERLGSGIFSAVNYLLYCHTHWLGTCQKMRSAKTVNPLFVGQLQRLIRRLAGQRRAQGESARRPPSSGMLGIALSLALCNSTTVVGSTLASPLARPVAWRQCAKYFDWFEFWNSSWSTLHRNLSRAGGRKCVTEGEYFDPASNTYHSWSREREALRSLHEAGLVGLVTS